MHVLRFALLVLAAVALKGAPAVDLDAELVFTLQPGTAREDLEIARWQQRAQATNATPELFERLGWAFVAKARRTQDSGFYTLADKTLDVMAARFGPRADGRLLRGHILHNLHRFRAAEGLARQLVDESPMPAALALLGDTLIDQGKLAEGIAIVQRLAEAKPGAEAWARVAHVRWLKGDLPGAISALESAVQAGDPRDGEGAAWQLARLSGLYLQSGDTARALMLADAAGERAADYAPALLARGRALNALGKIGEALTPLRRAAELHPLPEVQWWLADTLRASDRLGEAEEVERALKTRGAAADPRTTSVFLATRGVASSTAVRLARAEFEQRADIFTHDALAWALLANGEPAAAEAAMEHALAEKTADARLALHAGEIARVRGKPAAAGAFFAAAKAAAATLTPSERALLERRLALPAFAPAP